MSVWLKRTLWGVLLFLLVGQIVRPSKTNPPIAPKDEIAASVAVPPDVASILARSCNDCHSNRTVWPWYSNIAPVSWLVAYDVKAGRKELNFSEWGTRSAERNSKMLSEICKEVTEKEMPGLIYPLMHPAAKLTDADIQTICRWTQAVQPSETETRMIAP